MLQWITRWFKPQTFKQRVLFELARRGNYEIYSVAINYTYGGRTTIVITATEQED